MQQHGIMVENNLVISESKPEDAHDPHCFQITEVTNIHNFEKSKVAIIRALDNSV